MPTPARPALDLRRPDLRALSALVAVLTVMVLIVPTALAVGHPHAVAGVLYLPAAFAALVLFARVDLPTFGLANGVTLLRLGLVAVLAAGLALPAGEPGSAWAVTGLAVLTLSLDGVDGWLARRTRRVSAYGARFDMEVDTGFILVGALLAVHLGKAGSWVLLAPLLRPAFLLAARFWPWLAAPLPPSLRRKSLCALFGIGLTVALAPPVGPGLASAVLAMGLLALVLSFAIDVRWLRRKARTA